MKLPVVLPATLREMVETRKWAHPGDEVLRRALPELEEPVDFLRPEQFRFLAYDTEHWSDADLEQLRLARDSLDLPWLDPNKAFVLAVNRIPGDDVAIVLDFRHSAQRPRVVVSRWGDSNVSWVEVARSFDEFASILGLVEG